MAISVERNRKVYTADGSETTFQYDFRIFVDSDLTVLTVDPITQVETTKVLNVDYTVTNAGEETGGNVVFTTAPTDTHYVVLWGTYNFKQETEFDDGDSFPASSIENGLDKCTCQNIRQYDEINRALKMSVAYTGDALYLPFPAAGKIIGWNDDATEFVHYDNPKVYSDAAAVSAAAALVSENNAATSEDNAETYKNQASGYADAASSSMTTASGLAVDAAASADLARAWASASGIVADGFKSAREYALEAYQTVYSGVEPAFPIGTRMWFYQSLAPDGWSVVADTGDRLLATATYSGAAGGNTAGSWTYTGFSSDSTGSHTHTMANHTHTGPNHQHAGVDHLHSMNGHTHTYEHYHAIGTHSHTSNAHNHSVSISTAGGCFSVGGCGEGPGPTTFVSAVSSPTGNATDTINASASLNTGWSSSVGYYITSAPNYTYTAGSDRALTTGLAGTGATGAPSTNTSDSGGAHSHTISHTGADRPAACVGIICEFTG